MTVSTIDTSAAERRALRIGLRLDTIADNYEAVVPMIREALDAGDHETLGYTSPGAYLADRFGNSLSRMPIVVRREFVGELTEAGLSTRAIASVTGTDARTVRRDQSAGGAGAPPEPEALTDEPGRVMKLTGEGSATDYTETGEATDDYLSDDATGEEVTSSSALGPDLANGPGEEAPGEEVEPGASAPSRPDVTGMDGKTYKQREKAKRKRRPLTDAFTDKRWEMQKALESLSRLTADDRFPQNAEKVATANRSDLIRIKDQLELVIEQLPEHI